jgi:CTP synthase (UTP-ammonia lyase)
MKLQLIRNIENAIDGFHSILYTDPAKINDLNNITTHSCEYILGNSVLDDFDISDSDKIVYTLITKLRLGGTLILNGHDINILAKSILNKTIESKTFSDIIKEKRSINTALNVMKMLESNGLKISTVKYSDYIYEIVSIREKP